MTTTDRASIIDHAARESARAALAADPDGLLEHGADVVREYVVQDADIDGLRSDLRAAGLDDDITRDDDAAFVRAFRQHLAAEVAAARYTTRGSVRGGCGHLHRTADAARACLQRDQRGCERQGGYSDRGVRVVLAGTP